MTTRGTRLPSLDPADLADGLADVATPVRDALAGADRLTLVPDVHYPYHPSTGMVTNPDVVGALLSTLAPGSGTDCVVAVRSAPAVDTARTAEYLGYDDVVDAREGSLVVLDDDTTTAVETGTGTLTLPTTLVDTAVVVVPSARIGGAVPLFGSLALLAGAAGVDPSNPTDVTRAREAVAPVGAVVDGTYTFTGRPARARVLLGGDDVAAVDRALADLLSVDPGSVPGLAAGLRSTVDAAGRVDGLDVAALAATLPDGALPASSEPHPVVRAAYRLYTRVSGDVYPPQLEGDA